MEGRESESDETPTLAIPLAVSCEDKEPPGRMRLTTDRSPPQRSRPFSGGRSVPFDASQFVSPALVYCAAAILGDLTGSLWLVPSEVVKVQTQVRQTDRQTSTRIPKHNHGHGSPMLEVDAVRFASPRLRCLPPGITWWSGFRMDVSFGRVVRYATIARPNVSMPPCSLAGTRHGSYHLPESTPMIRMSICWC